MIPSRKILLVDCEGIDTYDVKQSIEGALRPARSLSFCAEMSCHLIDGIYLQKRDQIVDVFSISMSKISVMAMDAIYLAIL